MEQGKGIPEGASVVTPRLFCRDPVAQIEFWERQARLARTHMKSPPSST